MVVCDQPRGAMNGAAIRIRSNTPAESLGREETFGISVLFLLSGFTRLFNFPGSFIPREKRPQNAYGGIRYQVLCRCQANAEDWLTARLCNLGFCFV
jgi:hypothetical protein